MKIKSLPFLFVIALLLCGGPASGQHRSQEDSVINQFEKQLGDDVANDGLHGTISAAVIVQHQMIWSGAVEYIRRDSRTQTDTNTLFRIGSITKTFTATVLMQLLEEGKIKLDDPVEQFLPEIKYLPGYHAENKIAFRQLASHTSGLNREPGRKGADIGPVADWESKLLKCIPY